MTIELDPIGSGFNRTKVDNNFQKTEDEFNNNVLRRDGVDSDNSMKVDLDMNGKRILNLPTPLLPTDPLRLQDAGLPITGEITLRDLTTSTTVATAITADALLDNVLLVISSTAPVVITLDASPANTVIFFLQDTIEQVTFQAGIGVTIKTPLGLAPYTQNSICFAYSLNSTTWVLGGDLG